MGITEKHKISFKKRSGCWRHLFCRFSFTLIIIFFSSFSFAQEFEPSFYNYTVEDGLPGNEVYSVFEDSKGYLWIATDRGIAVYDGYKFKPYTTNDGLPDNTIFGFYEDYQGRIWFRSYNGKIAYFKNNKFYHVQIPEEYTNSYIGGIKVNSQNTVYIKSFNGSWEFQLSKQSDILVDASSIKRHNVENMNRPQSPTTEAKMHCYIKNHWNSESKLFKNFDYYIADYVYHKGENDTSLLANDSLITSFSSSGKGIFKSKKFKSLISYVYSKNNKTYIGFRQGGYQVYGDFLFNDAVSPVFLDGKTISSISHDSDGGIWVSTLQNGIYYAPNETVGKLTISKETREENITHVTSLDGRLFLGSRKGELFSVNKNGERQEYEGSHFDGVIRQLENLNGKVYFTVDNTIRIIDSSLKSSLFTTDGFPLTHKFDEDGNMWSGTKLGLKKNMLSGATNHILLDQRVEVICAIEDTLWIGGLNGLMFYDKVKEEFKPYSDINALLKNRIVDFKKTKSGVMLIATRGAGLLFKNGTSINQLSEEQGLVSNLVNNIYCESDSVFWISSNKGASRIELLSLNPFSYNVKNFNQSNGLLSRQVNFVYGFGDTLVFGTPKGVNVLRKNYSEEPIRPPPIYISTLSVNEKDTALKANYVFEHDQNRIVIGFKGLSYKRPNSLTYKYRLLGADTVWNYTENTSVPLLSLPKGEYTFEVVAINSDGTESSKPAKISFVITPPFWLTWWFITLEIIFVILLMFLVTSRRIKQIRKENKIKAELLKLENKALSAQMNPHFIFNALTSIQNFILKEKKYEAYDYLTQFAVLMRSILKNSEKGEVLLKEEVELLNLYLELEKIRFNNEFEYDIIIGEGANEEFVKVPSMLIQPYVENSIRHGFLHKKGKGKLKIEFKVEDKRLVCVIADNGVGREMAMKVKEKQGSKHESFAMGINSRRLELLNEIEESNLSLIIDDLYENDKPSGTKVTLYVPLKNN